MSAPSDPIGAAARAVQDAIAAACGGPGSVLSPGGELVDIGDGTWGQLAVYGGTPVRITVELARPEEAEALGFDPDTLAVRYAEFTRRRQEYLDGGPFTPSAVSQHRPVFPGDDGTA